MPGPNVLQAATELAVLSRRDLWVRYVALGGTASPGSVGCHVSFGGLLDDHQHDVLVHALNERFADLGLGHPVPYRHEPPVGLPRHEGSETTA